MSQHKFPCLGKLHHQESCHEIPENRHFMFNILTTKKRLSKKKNKSVATGMWKYWKNVNFHLSRQDLVYLKVGIKTQKTAETKFITIAQKVSLKNRHSDLMKELQLRVPFWISVETWYNAGIMRKEFGKSYSSTYSMVNTYVQIWRKCFNK